MARRSSTWATRRLVAARDSSVANSWRAWKLHRRQLGVAAGEPLALVGPPALEDGADTVGELEDERALHGVERLALVVPEPDGAEATIAGAETAPPPRAVGDAVAVAAAEMVGDRLGVGGTRLTCVSDCRQQLGLFRVELRVGDGRGDEFGCLAVDEPQRCVVRVDARHAVLQEAVEDRLLVGSAGDERADAFEPLREVEAAGVVDRRADQHGELLQRLPLVVASTCVRAGRAGSDGRHCR